MPALVVLVFAGAGAYYVESGHAAAVNCYIFSAKQGNGFWSGQGYQSASNANYMGSCVSKIQTLVNFQLYGASYASNRSHIAIDGRYGTITASAVSRLQTYYKSHGFPHDSVDGEVGPQTLNDMLCRMQSISGNYDFWTNAPESALESIGCPSVWG